MKQFLYYLFGWLALTLVFKPCASEIRVVNGENVELGEIPYQVSMQDRFGHFCGGSIINDQWIVTAAHCMDYTHPYSVMIAAGTVDFHEPCQFYQPVKKIVHENYSEFDSFVNDICLIKVQPRIQFSDIVQPATLPEPHAKVKTNSIARTSGWGLLMNNTAPYILQKANLYIADQEYCREKVEEYDMTVYPTQICANDPSKIRGDCIGDSGGPLTVDGVLHGIISWSIKDPFCGSPHIPSVYIRVSEYIDWINDVISKN